MEDRSQDARTAGIVLGGLRTRGAIGWYVGATISLLWLLRPAQAVIAVAPSPASATAGIATIVVFAAAFLVSVPLQRVLRPGRRILVSAGLLLLSFALIPWLGTGISSMWTYVGVSVGMAAVRAVVTVSVVAALAVATVILTVSEAGWTEDALWEPAILFSISAAMAAFAQMQTAMERLRASQRQVAELAAERERGRIARDIHDILGHSLTVVTVKSELAGRLVDRDPARAKAEIAEVEALARGALADVRTTVAGSHGVTITGELAAARAALDAAGVTAELPSATDIVPREHRELAGWVVREGVTNVVRHASASMCRVRLDGDGVRIEDDGIGPGPATAGSSTGLTGLRERVESAGGRLSVGRSDLGGFSLQATFGKGRA